ncbi:MAG: tRNA-splicing ligase RtcB [Verrucomicrobiales bacterium]|jgi:tRNA-splicing ligase RtcB
MKISGQDLIEAGWAEEADFTPMFAELKLLAERGITEPKYALKLLARKFPKDRHLIEMRNEPAPFSEAIEAETEVDEENIGKVRRFMRDLMRCPVVEAGSIMPDACPAGNQPATIPVGGAVAARRAILPGGHGHDICCSMFATFFTCDRDTDAMMDHLVDSTRFGPGGRPREDLVHHEVLDEPIWQNKFLAGLRDHAVMHMADQGDGNHFGYIGKVEFSDEAFDRVDAAGHQQLLAPLRGKGEVFALVTHHGSRGLGSQLYRRGINAAIKQTAKIAKGIPEAASWLSIDTPEGEAYWEALSYVGRWTKANHESIHARFLERAEGTRLMDFGNEHNFVWRRGDLFLHGKGATPAWTDEQGRPLLGLIPLNMAEPILIVLGRDNAEHLSFAPHGAGRNVSRRSFMKQFKRDDGNYDTAAMDQMLQRTTEGIDARWYLGKPDLSESPTGYKPAAQVRTQIEKFQLADIVAEIQPLGSVMAGSAPKRGEEPLTPKQVRQIQHRADRRKQRQHNRGGDWEEENM